MFVMCYNTTESQLKRKRMKTNNSSAMADYFNQVILQQQHQQQQQQPICSNYPSNPPPPEYKSYAIGIHFDGHRSRKGDGRHFTNLQHLQQQAGPSSSSPSHPVIKEEWNWISPNGTSGGTVGHSLNATPAGAVGGYNQESCNMDNISLPNLSDVNLSLLDNHLSENISGLNLLDDVQQVLGHNL